MASAPALSLRTFVTLSCALLAGLWFVAPGAAASRSVLCIWPVCDSGRMAPSAISVIVEGGIWAIWLVTLRLLLETPLQRLGVVLLGPKGSDDAHKFSEQSYKLLWHSFGGTLWILYIASTEKLTWMWEPGLYRLWEGRSSGAHVYSSLLRAFYLAQFGFIVESGIWHFFEERRKDFKLMLAHHVITALLIGLSYASNDVRIGCVVLMLHEITDVFGCCVKIAVYFSNARRGVWRYIAPTIFALVVSSWFICRIFLFARWILWTAYYGHIQFLGPHAWPEMTCFICLCILYGMQIYWFALFLRMAVNIIKGKQHDIREKTKSA